jgi:hypothetical protein
VLITVMPAALAAWALIGWEKVRRMGLVSGTAMAFRAGMRVTTAGAWAMLGGTARHNAAHMRKPV